MRHSLRRSCAACARSKHRCDLRTPRCSRCVKRKTQCTYVNEPLTGADVVGQPQVSQPVKLDTEPPSEGCTLTNYNRFGPVDPFDSYPRTRLPRERVQRLMYHFLNKIAFQYYPLDPSATSNPFLISWWPLALGDPVLFHVSLQTASLDEELSAQKGFQTSDLLMTDSVVLLRRRVQDPMLAMQDATMNSIITLAAIEFGKGNTVASDMHVDGVKRLVGLRGGLSSVRQTSPLTARMVSWVSMILTGRPQFDTQDDSGAGDGVAPIPTWQMGSTTFEDALTGLEINDTEIDQDVQNVFTHLRDIFHRARQTPLLPTQLHDLTCFTIHRLLLPAPNTSYPSESAFSECIRYTIVLYMFIIQGPAYFSHAVMAQQILARLVTCLKNLESDCFRHDPVEMWSHLIGIVASTSDSSERQWLPRRARARAKSLKLSGWDDIGVQVKRVLWFETPSGEAMFRDCWENCINDTDKSL